MAINLLCLPFAGGNKFSYKKYETEAPSGLKIIPLEYPGRGSRGNEPFITELSLLAEDTYSQVCPHLAEGGYALYGHSMGALLALLVTRKIVNNDQRPPLHLFISGAEGPSSLRRRQKQRHLMDKKKFIEEIIKFEGSPGEILQHEEFLNYIEPVLRADFTAIETYIYNEDVPLNIPITVINGTEDEELKPNDICLWQNETSKPVDFVYMQGKHFFIFDFPLCITTLMLNKLLSFPR